MSKGFVYLIKSADTGLYKIGVAKNVPNRLQTIKRQSGEHLEVIRIFQAQDKYLYEGRMHRFFEDKRKSGEWFDLSQQDLDDYEYYANLYQSHYDRGWHHG